MLTVHVVFSCSSVAALAEALGRSGLSDQIAAFPDNLSFGPINPAEPSVRARWMEIELQHAPGQKLDSSIATFWDKTLTPGIRRVVWMSRRCASEYAGFLYWLWRSDDAACEIVDLTEMRVAHYRSGGKAQTESLALALPLLSADTILSNNLLDQARELPPTERAAYQEIWERLQKEDAPLRVIKGGQLTFAPIHCFDDQLLTCAKGDWRKFYHVVGEALATELFDDILQTNDAVLAARMRALLQAGRLEGRGDFSDQRKIEVRRIGGISPIGN